MLLKSGFSGRLTTNGIGGGTAEIGPQAAPQQESPPPPPQQTVIGAGVSTFKSPPQPLTSILSNGSPLRMHSAYGAAEASPTQFVGTANAADPLPGASPLNSSFRINNFQKNGTSTLYAIANRNANGAATTAASGATMAVHNNGLASNQECAGTLIKSEVDQLKSVLYPQQQQQMSMSSFPLLPPASPALSTPQKGLNNQVQSPSPFHNQPLDQMSAPYLQPQPHNNNGLDIDQSRHFVLSQGAGDTSPPQPPPSQPQSMTLPVVDSFATNHQRHDEIQLLNQIQDTLKEGWTVHLAENGRLYYCK